MKKTIKRASINQAKWRAKKGTSVWKALTEEEIRVIRHLRKSGDTLQSIAKRYGKSVEGIRRHCLDLSDSDLSENRSNLTP